MCNEIELHLMIRIAIQLSEPKVSRCKVCTYSFWSLYIVLFSTDLNALESFKMVAF